MKQPTHFIEVYSNSLFHNHKSRHYVIGSTDVLPIDVLQLRLNFTIKVGISTGLQTIAIWKIYPKTHTRIYPHDLPTAQ